MVCLLPPILQPAGTRTPSSTTVHPSSEAKCRIPRNHAATRPPGGRPPHPTPPHATPKCERAGRPLSVPVGWAVGTNGPVRYPCT